MDKREAIDAISIGHNVYSEEYAREIFKAFDVEFPEYLVFKGYSDTTDPKGLRMEEEGEKVVTSLDIGNHLCKKFNLNFQRMGGRGFQGRAYAEALQHHFKEEL